MTRNRTQQVTASVVQQFPPLPYNQTDFGRLGLNQRPTFFGCDPKKHAEYPLLIYIPNAPPVDGGDPVTKWAILVIFGNMHSSFVQS
jgi:lysophospholipase